MILLLNKEIIDLLIDVAEDDPHEVNEDDSWYGCKYCNYHIIFGHKSNCFWKRARDIVINNQLERRGG